MAGCAVLYVHERVRVIAWGGKEPRLDKPPIAYSLNPTGALREPHVAQTATEQTTLTVLRRCHAERAESLVYEVGVNALPVISAAQLVLPARQRRGAQWSQLIAPALQ